MYENNIKHYREVAQLSRAELGKEIKRTQSAISHYESGRRSLDIQLCWSIVSTLNKYGVKCSLAEVFPPPAS